MSDTTQVKTHKFQAEVNQVLSLVINSLYSNKEIFLRELVSNASDALDKLRFRAITEKDLMDEGETLAVRMRADREAGTLTIADNGVGMTEAELVENLGTIAHSGSRAFLENIKAAAEQKEQANNPSFIGQFGVGFYSAYLVADKVEVITRPAGHSDAWRWISDAQGEFTTEPAEREERGTSIVLHLKEDQRHLLDDWKLRNLISTYSDYVDHPIQLFVEREVPIEGAEDSDDDAPKTRTEQAYETVNQARALWSRSPSEVEDAEYEEFYKHLTHDWEKPLTRNHFKIEGTQLFTGLLFVPRRAPFDLFDPERRHGVRLYVKRVFIMDDCEEVLPKWLRFVRGIIDSDDLPLNVSRELLQDSSVTRTIRKQVVRKALDAIEELAENNPEDYAHFWNTFGVVFKEGLHFEPKHKNRLADLLRYESSAELEDGEDKLVSLRAYVDRMPFSQKAIYYAMGASRQAVESSPHLEAIKKRGYEVLYMTDPIDQWAVQALEEYDGKKLISVMAGDLDLGDEDDADKEKREAAEKELSGLTGAFKAALGDKVKQVRASDRLTDSPVCLVVPEGGLHAHIERMLRLNNQQVPNQARILEINPDHELIGRLKTLQADDAQGESLNEWIEMLYDQALLAEGSPIENPAGFAARMTRLMLKATE